MRYEILLAPEALADLRALKANLRAEVRDAIEDHLRHEPTAISRARIKDLEGEGSPEFRLRVGDIRVFYDVVEGQVWIVAIVTKDGAEGWLRKAGR
jgi:mRNA-degrading endonuclease RelE of RelBE toxin-antitoxin system